MRTLDRDSIFDSNAQLMSHIDPASIRPIWDRLLVEDVPDDPQMGRIIIPQTAAPRGVGKKGLLRIGLVVAVGRGDKFIERRDGSGKVMFDERTEQPFRLPAGECRTCNGSGMLGGKVVKGERDSDSLDLDYMDTYGWSDSTVLADGDEFTLICPTCLGDGISRFKPYCKPGDRIVYDRRKEAEIYINGKRYTLIHEEQSVLGVLD